jgi:hypothetical protein
VLGVGVVGVCCKPKGMCGVVAILGVSCQLNTMTRTLLRVLEKMIVVHQVWPMSMSTTLIFIFCGKKLKNRDNI